jgi:hypothetical protein
MSGAISFPFSKGTLGSGTMFDVMRMGFTEENLLKNANCERPHFVFVVLSDCPRTPTIIDQALRTLITSKTN